MSVREVLWKLMCFMLGRWGDEVSAPGLVGRERRRSEHAMPSQFRDKVPQQFASPTLVDPHGPKCGQLAERTSRALAWQVAACAWAGR